MLTPFLIINQTDRIDNCW